MKAANSHGNTCHKHNCSRQLISVQIRPVTAPSKQRSKSPSPYANPRPPRLHNSPERPQTSVGFYEEKTESPARPRSALGIAENVQTSSLRSKKKIKTHGKTSPKLKRRSRKPAHIAWENESRNEGHRGSDSSRWQKRQDKLFDANGKELSEGQQWLLKRRKKRAAAGKPLVPGSVPTMIALQGPDADDVDDDIQTVEITRPPSFADVVFSDDSSDFETDIEEDFPVIPKEFDPSGRTSYVKLCKEKDLVPVSYLTERLTDTEITMRYHGLGTEGTFPVAKSLMKNTFTERLDLTENYVEAPGAISLAQMLFDNCFITEIDLSMNFIRAEGGLAFAQMLHTNQSLKKLVLKSNHLTDRVAKAFAEALRENRTLTYLDLSHNEIGEEGGIYLGAGLASNYGLKHLDISWNCIRFKGAVGMAQALKVNDCLTHFNMSWNGLSLLGCVALGRFLKKNEVLRELDISNNRIGLLATQKLSAGIASHPNLKVLKIGKNPVGDGGVECLLSVVRVHPTIKYLSLEDVTVSPKIFDEIKELEQERDITIITGGIGGYKRPKEMPPGMRILLNFISENRLRLIDWFNQFDKDHSGGISREEFSKGLKETGLVMTKRQLDRLMEYIDINNDGEIEYSELLRGREMTIQELRQERKIEERNKRIEEGRMRLPKLEGYDYDLM